jgi:FAD binding domain
VGEPAGLTAARLPGTAQVVVAGGGPVGLACAVELGRRGITCLVIEPRDTVSHARPRCKTVNVRSMQHLRRWGIAGRLRDQAPLAPAWSSDAVFCTSLAGRELSRFTGVLGLVPTATASPSSASRPRSTCWKNSSATWSPNCPRASWRPGTR